MAVNSQHRPKYEPYYEHMKWADLVLSYVEALAWPSVVVWALWAFRSQIGSLILSAKRVTAFGAEAEFDITNIQIKQTELEVKKASSGSPKLPESLPQDIGDILSTVKALLSFDIDSTDSANPVRTAKEMTRRLGVALQASLNYFGVPWPAISAQNAGAVMERLTGQDVWAQYITLFENIKKDSDLLRERRIFKTQFNSVDEPREISGQIYRISLMLPVMLERSLAAKSEKPGASIKSSANDEVPIDRSASTAP